MDIRVLSYFLMVAREENITRAAQLLHVTQPTLSRQLMQLEEEMGVALLERKNHSVSLTYEGMLFRRRAQDMVDLARRAKDEVAVNEDTVGGNIAIGCGELQAVVELSKLLAAFQKQFPKVKFALYSGSNEDIQEKLEQGNLDLGLFLEPFNSSNYEFVRMKTREEWGVLLHREHPLAAQECICPGDLVGTKVVTIHVNTPVHQTLADWSGDYARDMDFCVNYNVLHNGVIVARERKGAVICLKSDAHYEDMIFRPFKPKLEFGSVLAWHNGKVNARAFQTFLQFITRSKMSPTSAGGGREPR